MYNKFRRSRSDEDEDVYKQARREFKTKQRSQYEAYMNELQLNIQSNPKVFWNYVGKTRRDSGVPVNVTYKSMKADCAGQAAELFADYFNAVYSERSEIDVPVFSPCDERIPDITLSLDEVRKKIETLDGSKGSGPDGIPNLCIKMCAEAFALPLFELFSFSLRCGYFPMLWKISHIVPIHKKGSKLPVENYRGISILSAIPKMFESLIYDQLYSWIEPRLSICQHGFLKKRSTTTNLVEFVSRTTQWMMDGLQVDTLYTDMSKAFDVVNTGAILSVLRKHGIEGPILRWLQTYLENRTQYVKLHQSRSKAFSVDSGVPQGSHLGPLLFITVMNVLPSFLDGVYILIYADDVKIFIPVSCLKDCQNLQWNIELFSSFCRKFGLKINVSKCNVVSFSRKINTIHFEYQMGADVINRSFCVNDLGVQLDSELTFTEHTEKVIAKANAMFGLIKRLGKDFDDPYTIISLYIGLVRSTIEYASVVWQPYYETHKTRIESVQKKFVRFALRNLGWRDALPNYKSLCMLVGIDSLEIRRKMADALFLKDVIDDRYVSPYLAGQVSLYEGRSGLRQVRPFQIPNRVQNYARNEPMYRIMSFYNANRNQFNVEKSKEKIKHVIRCSF